MRLIAGKFKGRPIDAPTGLKVRPTSDRVREALFNILEHGPVPLAGARALDLFAGSGALGLEALSRGAAYIVFVENASISRAAIRRNVDALGAGGHTRILKRSATDLGPLAPQMAPFDIAFLDPPYKQDLAKPALACLSDNGWLKPGATVIVEQSTGEMLTFPSRFSQYDERKYGETLIRFLAYSDPAD